MIQSEQSPPRLATLIVLTAITTMSLNLFLPALPSIARDLNTDYATISWAISGYLASTGVVQLVAGPLSDRIGRRPVVLLALTIFTFASIGCALAGDVETFLICRFCQSVAVAGFTMSLAIVRDTTEARAATGRIGTITAAMAVVPMLSPVVGGIIDETLGWRACFWFYALTGAGLLLVAAIDLGETRRRASDSPAEGRARLLSSPVFWGFALCGAFSTCAFHVFLAGAPLVATAVFGFSPSALGLIIGSITFGFILGSTISARTGSKIGALPLIISGRSIACVGLGTGLLAVLLGPIPAALFFAATWCVGLGNGLTTPGTNASAMSVEPTAAGTAAGVTGAMTVFLAAGLTAVTGSLISGSRPDVVLLGLMLATSAVGFTALLLTRSRVA